MTIRMTGGKEIQRKLQNLSRDMAAGPMREVVMSGAEVVKKAAEAAALAIKDTGTLASDIHAEITKESIGTNVMAKVGPGKKGWYGRLVEYGHKSIRVTGRYKKGRRWYRNKKDLGGVEPHPWLRPAFDKSKDKAREVMGRELERRLDKAWRKK